MFIRLRQLREDFDLTQKQVASFLGMSQTGYNQYEIGKNDLNTYVLIKLSFFYNVSVDYILGLTNIRNVYPRIKK